MYEKGVVKYIPDEVVDQVLKQLINRETNWKQYAYVQYLTDWNYLCGAMINFVKLRQEYHTKLDLVLMVTPNIKISRVSPEGAQLYRNLDRFNIELRPVALIRKESDSTTWNKSFTKFQAFRLIEYSRIIYIDSDSKLNDKMDELFFLPECKIAMPALYDLNFRTYREWDLHVQEDLLANSLQKRNEQITRVNYAEDFDSWRLSIYNRLPSFTITKDFKFENQIMVIKPSVQEFEKLMKLTSRKKSHEYDMDLVNKLYDIDKIVNRQYSALEELLNLIPDVLVIPHLKYGFLSGELRNSDHRIVMAEPQDLPYIASPNFAGLQGYWNDWNDTEKMYAKIKLVHYSDFPIPKPWVVQKFPNDYAHLKILCKDNDDHRYQIYKNFNSVNEPLKHIEPVFVSDCALSEIWNNLYEEYKDLRESICAL